MWRRYNWIRGFAVLSLALQIFSLSIPTTYIYTQTTDSLGIDPAPLLRLLQDTIHSIISKDYEKALTLCREALEVPLTPEIHHIHRRVYNNLVDLIDILVDIDAAGSKALADQKEALDLIYRLKIAKSYLESSVVNYISKLSNMFQDQATKYLVTRSTNDYVASLSIKLEAILGHLTQMYLRSEYGEELHIHLSHPEAVEGGGRYFVLVNVSASVAFLENVNLTLVSIYGGIVSESISIALPINKTVAIERVAPSAKELLSRGIDPLAVKNVDTIAIVRAETGNITLGGYKVSNFSIIYTRPSLKFMVPSYIHPGQAIDLQIVSSVEVPLNLSVYLDSVSNDTLIMNTTIAVGENEFSLAVPNLSVGYHRLIFVTEPEGKYVPLVHSSIFAVVKHKVSVTVDIKEFNVVPLAKPLLNLYVDSPIAYSITVYADGRAIASYRQIDRPRISIEVDPPFTLLLWRYNLLIEVKPEDPSYLATTVEGRIYVINFPVVALLVLILGTALISPSSSRYIVLSLKTFSTSIGRTISRHGGKVPIASPIANVVRPIFRKTKLGKLYRVFLALISKYIEPPQSPETLREFYTRFDRIVVKPVKSFVKKFLEIYEEDLYSNHSIDISEAEAIVKRLKDLED